jgi:hypothetical protein
MFKQIILAAAIAVFAVANPVFAKGHGGEGGSCSHGGGSTSPGSNGGGSSASAASAPGGTSAAGGAGLVNQCVPSATKVHNGTKGFTNAYVCK